MAGFSSEPLLRQLQAADLPAVLHRQLRHRLRPGDQVCHVAGFRTRRRQGGAVGFEAGDTAGLETRATQARQIRAKQIPPGRAPRDGIEQDAAEQGALLPSNEASVLEKAVSPWRLMNTDCEQLARKPTKM